ncbi:hypothetical protein ACV1DV_20935 [Aeromonas veronii]
MSQGCASGGVRLLTPAELDALRDEMQRDGEWAREAQAAEVDQIVADIIERARSG